MTSLARRRRLAGIAVALAVLLTGSGAALATIPSGGVITGCYLKTGILRVIDGSSAQCKDGETALTWAQTPRPGSQGATGRRAPGATRAPRADRGPWVPSATRSGRPDRRPRFAGARPEPARLRRHRRPGQRGRARGDHRRRDMPGGQSCHRLGVQPGRGRCLRGDPQPGSHHVDGLREGRLARRTPRGHRHLRRRLTFRRGGGCRRPPPPRSLACSSPSAPAR